MSISFAPKIPTAKYADGIMACDVAEVNVSNSNGYAIQEALGLVPDYSGRIGATELRERCLVALMSDDGKDLAVPAVESIGEGGATIIDCGRREGYMQDRISSLLEMAQMCENYGWAICWG